MKELVKLEDNIKKVEEILNYEFKNKALLFQAFTRRSYTEENGGYDNEVLEFIGDNVLDYFVTRYIIHSFGFCDGTKDERYTPNENEFYGYFQVMKYPTEGKLSELKMRLVNKNMLAKRMDELGLNAYLIMGNGDILTNQHEEKSVKEDLFEAIIGAVAIDSRYDQEVLEELVMLMLNLYHYVLNDTRDYKDYIMLIQQWNQKENGCLPHYTFEIDEDGYHVCKLVLKTKIGDLVEYGDGDNNGEARNMCAENMYELLESKGLLFSMRDELPSEVSCENSIQILNKLALKGYISTPVYDELDEPNYDENGNPVWRCSCRINSMNIGFTTFNSLKKNAKKYAAYLCICKMFNLVNAYNEPVQDFHVGNMHGTIKTLSQALKDLNIPLR